MLTPERRKNILSQLSNPTAVVIENTNAGDQNKRYRESREKKNRNLISLLRDKESGLGLSSVRHAQTTSIKNAEDVVGEEINKQTGLVVVLGGDGTNAPVAQQLAERAAHKTHLVVMGGGMHDVLLSEMTRHRDPLKVAEAVLFNGHPVHVDLGLIEVGAERFPFLACAGLGLDAHVLDLWEKGPKQEGKKELAVFKLFLKERNNFLPYDLEIKSDYPKETFNFPDTILVPIINAGKYGKFFRISDSNMTDGILEVEVADSSSKNMKRLAGIVYESTLGSMPFDNFSYLDITSATITETNKQELIFQHDGEPKHADSSQLKVNVKHNAITLWVPNQTNSRAFLH